jgi:CBS domain-containing protein
MTVGDICTRQVAVVPPTALITDAAKRMRSAHVGDLVVVEMRNGRQIPVGIVTDRDIVISAVAGDPEHLHCLLVSDLMSDDLVVAPEHETITTALERMREHGVRRLPIVDHEGTLAGILTLDDILRHLTTQQGDLVALVTRAREHEQHYRV